MTRRDLGDELIQEEREFRSELGQAIAHQTASARSIEEVSARLSDLTRQINAATPEQSNGTQQVLSAGAAYRAATQLASSLTRRSSLPLAAVA